MAEDRKHIAHGTSGALREFVGECLGMAAFYASMGVDYASVADDRLLEVSLKKSVACTRQAVAVMKMLVEANEKALAAKAARDGAAVALGLEDKRR